MITVLDLFCGAEVTVFCPHCNTKYVKEMDGNEFREFMRKI